MVYLMEIGDLSSKLSETNKDIKEELVKMIQKTIDSDDEETFKKTLDSVIRNPKEMSIVGLMQDADLYEFYLKYRNALDENLNESGFFNKLQDFQKENNSISLYDFVVKGTLQAVVNILKELNEDLSSQQPTQ
jgi:5'-deoxynucleotidase YfbR-like HD superfamily hydrolase